MASRSATGPRPRDWAGDLRTLAGVWGVPAVAMVAATWLPTIAHGVVWAMALTWMGVACLLNARRCGRTHCWVTGPFFLGMAGLVAGYTAGVLPLGPRGWSALSLVTLIGFAVLWWGSERILGKYRR